MGQDHNGAQGWYCFVKCCDAVDLMLFPFNFMLRSKKATSHERNIQDMYLYPVDQAEPRYHHEA